MLKDYFPDLIVIPVGDVQITRGIHNVGMRKPIRIFVRINIGYHGSRNAGGCYFSNGAKVVQKEIPRFINNKANGTKEVDLAINAISGLRKSFTEYGIGTIRFKF